MTALWQAGAILLYAIGGLRACRAEPLKGVVFSDHSGEGPNRVGMIQLWVGTKVHDLDYGEPLPRRFRSEICWDIGAIWSVLVQVLPDLSLDISSVSCTGEVDENTHGPWLLVRDYLQLAEDRSASSSSLLSSRWRSSPEFQEYEAKVKDLDLSGNRLHGRPGRCIDIVKVEPLYRTQLRAGGSCYLKVLGKPVDLTFGVLRNGHTGLWEIDEIKIE